MLDGSAMLVQESVLNVCSRNNLSELVLPGMQFSDFVRTISADAKIIDRHYCISFSDVRNNCIAEELRLLNFVNGASLDTFHYDVRIAKFFYSKPCCTVFYQDQNSRCFAISHLQASLLLSCDAPDAFYLLQTVRWHVLISTETIGKFISYWFCIFAKRNLNELRASFVPMHDATRDRSTIVWIECFYLLKLF